MVRISKTRKPQKAWFGHLNPMCPLGNDAITNHQLFIASSVVHSIITRMGQHLLGLVLIVFGIMIDSMHCMYTTTTATATTTTTTTTTTEMDPFDRLFWALESLSTLFQERKDPLDDRVNLWPNGRVPYVISEELDSRAREKIYEAIEEFHQKTCVNFEPRLKSDQDYVHFVPHQNMCGTKVGNIGLDSYAREKINEAIEEFKQKTCVNFEPRLKSDQDYVHFVPHQEICGTEVGNIGLNSPIYLSPDCQRSKPMIQHEMMHALGNV